MQKNENKDKTVLVIEDERPLANAIRAKLESSGFGVTIARTVDQALNYIDELDRVDAIWLDHYLLGKETGLKFVTTLKESEGKNKSIPIFIVSNTASDEKVQSYIKLGVTKYYVKAENRLENIISEIEDSIKNLDAD